MKKIAAVWSGRERKRQEYYKKVTGSKCTPASPYSWIFNLIPHYKI